MAKDEVAPGAMSAEQLLREALRSAVRLAIVRSDLEADSTSDEEVAEDAAGACFGEDTEDEASLPEVAELLRRLELAERRGTGPRCPKCGTDALDLDGDMVGCRSCGRYSQAKYVSDFAQFFVAAPAPGQEVKHD